MLSSLSISSKATTLMTATSSFLLHHKKRRHHSKSSLVVTAAAVVVAAMLSNRYYCVSAFHVVSLLPKHQPPSSHRTTFIVPSPTAQEATVYYSVFSNPRSAYSSLQLSRHRSRTARMLLMKSSSEQTTTTVLCASKKGRYNNDNNNNQDYTSNYKRVDDGRDIGFVLLAFSLALSIWLFTIPPSFRRAYLCPTNYYDGTTLVVTDDTRVCTTLSEWFHGVTEYYKNGGGIQWDLSIDPQTIQDNQELWDAIVKTNNHNN